MYVRKIKFVAKTKMGLHVGFLFILLEIASFSWCYYFAKKTLDKTDFEIQSAEKNGKSITLHLSQSDDDPVALQPMTTASNSSIDTTTDATKQEEELPIDVQDRIMKELDILNETIDKLEARRLAREEIN